MIYLVILVGILVGWGIANLINNHKNPVPRDQFKRSQNKVLKDLKEKKDQFDKEITQEQLIEREKLRQAVEELNREFDSEKQHNEEKLQTLKEDYESKRAAALEIDKSAEAARQVANQEKIEEEQFKLNKELNQLSQQYKEQKEDLEKSFFQFSEQISLKKETLIKEINSYEERQKEIIARFKLDEERKQQAQFYSIQISEIEASDIRKLKTLSTTFSKPEILLKLVYETYYKTKLEEMFKRVLGENKDKGGIYKITNIDNNKVYIGKTTNFLSRWRTHTKRGCGIERISGQLYDAMFEDGLEHYMFEVVEVCSKEEQAEKEKYWIEFYKSNQYGYNQRKG